MKMVSRRQFLKRTAAFSLLAATGGALIATGGCTPATGSQDLAPQQGQGQSVAPAGPARAAAASVSRASAGDYTTLDPRNADNFTGRLNLPRTEGGLFGLLDLPPSRLELAAGSEAMEILPGVRTDLLAYRLELNGKTYFNPVFKTRPGARASVRLANRLDQETIVHWHGLHVDWRNDGHPSYAVRPGQSYDYDFAVQNRGATYWYHPHPHGHTGPQAYRGLAGLFVVEDEDEDRLREALDLELGVTDLPLVIQDKRFDDRGQLVYLTGGPMEQFMGFLGDTMAVNLAVNPSLDVDSRLYRFRLLNGSNARTYRLAFTKGTTILPFSLIGTDGGLLRAPSRMEEVYLSPAERADVLVDLRGQSEGEVVFLDSLPFDPMHNEMGGMGGMGPMGGHGGMMGQASEGRLPDGEGFHILRLAVRKRIAYDLAIPGTLAELAPAERAGDTRTFELAQGMMMRWTINRRTFDMDSALFSTRRNARETWEVHNADASMPHPMHLHGFPFRVLQRHNSPAQVRRLAVDGTGRLTTDLGWKDTVLVWPGETLAFAVDFSHEFEGEQTLLWHCHNLEHEDQGMMVNFRVL